MKPFRACVLAVVASLFLANGAASAAEITVASALAFRPILADLVPSFERSTGHHVKVIYGSAGAIRDRVRGGESIEVIISSTPMVTQLVDSDRIPPESALRLARSFVGVAVRSGAPKLDVDSAQSFRAAMLSAESVAHPDPNGGFLSGIHIARVFEQLGIGDQMKAKAKLMPGREACELVAKGGVQLAIIAWAVPMLAT